MKFSALENSAVKSSGSGKMLKASQTTTATSTTRFFTTAKATEPHSTRFTPSDETADTWNNNEEEASERIVNQLGKVIEKGTVRRFNKADISAPGERRGTEAHYHWEGCWPPPNRHWAYRKQVMEELEKEGRLVYSSTGRVYEKRYLDESKGT